MNCARSGCLGTIVDGYCEDCGMAPRPESTSGTEVLGARPGPAPSEPVNRRTASRNRRERLDRLDRLDAPPPAGPRAGRRAAGAGSGPDDRGHGGPARARAAALLRRV